MVDSEKKPVGLMGKRLAAIRAMDMEKPAEERICHDPYAARFAGKEGREAAEKTLREFGAREKFMAPPLISSPLRTRYGDDHIKKCAAEGVQQVVILGAGYDSRALRLEELMEIRVFEVDEPETIADKKEKVQEIVGWLPGQVAYVAIDFVKETLEDLKKKLKEQGYDPDKKTLFVMEGLVAHIGEAAVDELLRFITSFSGKGSSMLSTYIHKGIVKELAEILKRSVFGIDPDQIESFLSERGFCQINNTPITRIQERYCKEITPIPETYFIVDAVIKG